MPINKIAGSKRGQGVIAAVMATATAIGGVWYAKGVDDKQHPAAVVLAVQQAEKWEGFAGVAYLDKIAKPPVWTLGFGETLNVKPGMKVTRVQAETMLYSRMEKDYYAYMKKCIKGFETMPVGVQASALMGAYNYGEARWCHSTAFKLFAKKKYKEGCAAQTAFNKAGGKIVRGLVLRREMGDAQRLGEAELCLSGLPL